ncbi:MAG TPA: hypothetical protein VHF65_04815 [Nitrososphaera sp.]|nr:hypothetical protein [Nitrososphaera sp.]
MLSHTIAMPATISTEAMMITASLISTTKEFTENTYNSIDISMQHQQRLRRINQKGGLGTNDI